MLEQKGACAQATKRSIASEVSRSREAPAGTTNTCTAASVKVKVNEWLAAREKKSSESNDTNFSLVSDFGFAIHDADNKC